MPTSLRQLKPLGWEFSKTPHKTVATSVYQFHHWHCTANGRELRGLNLQFNIQSRLATYFKWSTIHITGFLGEVWHGVTWGEWGGLSVTLTWGEWGGLSVTLTRGEWGGLSVRLTWGEWGGLSVRVSCVCSCCSITASSRSKLDDPVSSSSPVVVRK